VVFRPAGAPIKVKFGKFHLDRLRGVVYCPQDLIFWNFTNLITSNATKSPATLIPGALFTNKNK